MDDSIKVVTDSTIFVLFLHYTTQRQQITTDPMEATSQGPTSHDIDATDVNWKQLLSDHVFPGCDTVECYCGIGNTKTVKDPKEGNYLKSLKRSLGRH